MKTYSIVSIALSSFGELGSLMLIFAPEKEGDVQTGVLALFMFGFYLVFSILVYRDNSGW